MGRTLAVWAALTIGAAPAFAQVNFGGGFGTPTGLQNNGSSVFAANRIQLTQAAGNLAGSCFFTTQQSVTSFNTSFTFQFTPGSNPMADGICFVLQRAGVGAVGATGGALGYSGMATSVAVKFDIYDNTGSYTGMYTNGTNPDLPQTTLNPGINFHTGNICRADLTYNGTTLGVTITDTVTMATAAQSYAINIATTIGGNTAFVGFTGGTGGLTAIQEIVTWTFTNPPPAPATLTASQNQLQQITLNWAAVAGATSYNVLRSAVSGGPYAQIANVPAPTTTYVDMVAGGGTFYYVVQAVSATGTSVNSPQATGYSVPPPRTSGHDEGLFGNQCACGSSAGGTPWAAAFAAALALLALRRRP